MNVVRNKYGKLLKKDNIVVFPGALDGLIEKGLDAVEDVDYELAVESFDQVYHFDPDNMRLLAPYAVSLYETRNFEKAKEIATKLLHSGAAEYLDAMELYLAISIQLQDYEEVEMTIATLLEENIVPPDMIKKFNYLRDLNNRLASRYAISEEPMIELQEALTIEEFLANTPEVQQQIVASMENRQLEAESLKLLAEIAEHEEIHPLVVTYALVLLRDAACDKTLTVKKFGFEKAVVPTDLHLPNQDEKTREVIDRISDLNEKDPSRMQMAIEASLRYGIIAYPFSWEGFSAEEVAQGYIHYIDGLFTGVKWIDSELMNLIQSIDEQTEQ